MFFHPRGKHKEIFQPCFCNGLSLYFFYGDTFHGSTFIHLDDLINAILKAVERRKTLPPDLILNIDVEERGNTVNCNASSAPKFFAKWGASLQNLFGNNFIKPWMIDVADEHMEMDSSKAERLRNWKSSHLLRNTLPKMITMLISNPKIFYTENKLKK